MSETIAFILYIAIAIGVNSLILAVSFGVGAGLMLYFRKKFHIYDTGPTTVTMSSSGESLSRCHPIADYPVDYVDEMKARRQEKINRECLDKARHISRQPSATELMVEPLSPGAVQTSWTPGERIGRVQESTQDCNNSKESK